MLKALILFYLRRIKELNSPGAIIGFAAKRYAEKTFLIEHETNRQVTFRELVQKAQALAMILSEKGMGRGDVLAFSGSNCIEYFEARVACHLSGIVLFAMPAHLNRETVEYFLKKSKAKLWLRPEDIKSGIASSPGVNQEAPRNDGDGLVRRDGEADIVTLNDGDGVVRRDGEAGIVTRNDEDGVTRRDGKTDTDSRKDEPSRHCETREAGRSNHEFKVNCRISIPGLKTGLLRLPRFARGPRNDEGVGTSDIATFNLSSGTTGKIPKIVQLTEDNWVESLYGYIRNSDTLPKQKITFLCCLPYATAGSTTFLPSLLAGITYIVVKENPPPEALAGYINKYAVNRLYLTPSALIELTEWCKTHNQRLSYLQSIITGTERMPAPLLKEAIDHFGPIISVGYGMVEALPPIAMLSPNDYGVRGTVYGDNILGSAGKILKGVRIKILKNGQIALKSKTVGRGYFDNPEENQACFQDGWFHSNDYGYIDNNYLYVRGRKEEIVGYRGSFKSGIASSPEVNQEAPRNDEEGVTRHDGENRTAPRNDGVGEAPRNDGADDSSKTAVPIFAADMEERLYELPFIRRCAAIAKDNRIAVFVSLRSGIEKVEAQKKIIDFAKTSFKDMPIPDTIVVKDALPVNELGKLDRKRLERESGLSVGGFGL